MVLPGLIENSCESQSSMPGAAGFLILLHGASRRSRPRPPPPRRVEVNGRQAAVTSSDLPQSHALRDRTEKSVVLDDASVRKSVFDGENASDAPQIRPVPAHRQADEAYRRALSREQPDSARLHIGSHRGAGVLAGKAAIHWRMPASIPICNAAKPSWPKGRASVPPKAGAEPSERKDPCPSKRPILETSERRRRASSCSARVASGR